MSRVHVDIEYMQSGSIQQCGTLHLTSATAQGNWKCDGNRTKKNIGDIELSRKSLGK